MDTASQVLAQEVQWLQRVLQFRCQQRSADARTQSALLPPLISLSVEQGYGALINAQGFDFENRLLLILAYAPCIAPQLLDREIGFWVRQFGNATPSEMQPLWGLVQGQMYRGLLPTGALFLFLCCGDLFESRFELQRRLLYQQLPVMSEGIVQLSDVPVCEPPINGILSVESSYMRSLML